MAMSRKDYDILAAIIRDVRRTLENDEHALTASMGDVSTDGAGIGAAMEIQNRMAYVFKEANANFDTVKWAAACRPQKGG